MLKTVGRSHISINIFKKGRRDKIRETEKKKGHLAKAGLDVLNNIKNFKVHFKYSIILLSQLNI